MTRSLPLTRREFLAASAAATAAFARGDEPSGSPYGSWTVGAQSYSFREFDLERALQQYKELGLRYAEFFNKHVKPESTPEQVAAVKKLCGEYGVTPIAFGVHTFTRDHAKSKRVFEVANMMGIKYLSADPDPDSFDSLDKLCQEFKIAIAIHPHGPTGRGQTQMHRWYSAEVILPAVKDHHPLIGTC